VRIERTHEHAVERIRPERVLFALVAKRAPAPSSKRYVAIDMSTTYRAAVRTGCLTPR
jgi:hypothetical protein